MKKIKVTVWNEYLHELNDTKVAEVYPDGIHNCIKDFLVKEGMDVKIATLEMPKHGLTDEVLQDTDVLIWWGHIAHDKVDDEIVLKVKKRVQEGMGLIPLHSAHASKIFCSLMGTDASLLKWREAGEKEVLWVVNPSHQIASGIEDKILIPQEEMYGEHFNIPTPDELLFVSWFEGGEVFRSGCCWSRGKGKIFYFQPGHETYPTYHLPQIQKIIINAVHWACPTDALASVTYGNVNPVFEL